jgi:hypothetical protein
MTKKLLLAVGSLMFFSGTIALQGCSESGPGYGYGPGYYSAPAYYPERGYYAGNGYVGDYQEHRYWQDRDINNDARAIRRGQANIRHDKQELREDLGNRDYRAAAHEHAEIQQRRANVRARRADRNADLSNRY